MEQNLLSRSIAVLKVQGAPQFGHEDSAEVSFGRTYDGDGDAIPTIYGAKMSHRGWEDMGRPTEIIVSIKPGNTIEED